MDRWPTGDGSETAWRVYATVPELRIVISKAARWAARHLIAIGVGSTLIAFDAADLAAGKPTILSVGGAASVLYGVADLVRRGWQDWRDLKKLILKRPAPRQPDYERPYSNWTVLALRDVGHGVHHPTVNDQLIREARIPIRRIWRIWEPEGEAAKLRRLVGLRLDFDQSKIRQQSDLLPDTEQVTLRRTKYSAFIVTNKLALKEWYRQKSSSPTLAYADNLHNGRIPVFKRSQLSNHIGVDVLAFSADRIVLVQQSDKNQLSQNLLAPSGSGSADWRDTRGADDLITVVKTAMRREMHEELGLRGRPSRTLPLDSIKVIGFARLTHLAGKPQFFGVARLDEISERIRRSERRYVDDHDDSIEFDPERGVTELLKSIDRFERDRIHLLSFPLYVNIQLLRQWLQRDADAAEWLRLAADQAR